MRAIVTGSRTWSDSRRVWDELATVAEECRNGTLYVRHGGCKRGTDEWAHRWTERYPMFGFVYVVEEIYRAAWERENRRAGILRNHRMGDDGPVDLCLAFGMLCTRPNCPRGTYEELAWPRPHITHGTADMADYAISKGIPVRRFRG